VPELQPTNESRSQQQPTANLNDRSQPSGPQSLLPAKSFYSARSIHKPSRYAN